MTATMTALLALIRKDVLLFLRDRRALLLTLVMPLLLGALMGYVFGGKSKGGSIEVALVAADTGAVGKAIAASLRADASLTIRELPLDEAREQVRKGKLNLAIVLPAGFGEAAGAALFGAGAKPEIPIYYDPSQASVLAMAKGILTQHVMQAVSAAMFSGSQGTAMVETSLKQLERKADASPDDRNLRDFLASLRKFQLQQPAGSPAAASGGLAMPFATRDEEMSSGPKFNGFGHAFTGMSVQFILMMSIDVGAGLLLARRSGIWNRLLAAPLRLETLLLSRMLSAALIAFAVMCTIFAIATVAFHVPLANPAGFLGVAACFALTTGTFGLMLAAFGKTPEATRGIGVFATLLMVMLGGAWVPSFLFPPWVLTLTAAIPTRWAIDGIAAMTWRGLGIEAALQSMGALLAFSLLFGLLAMWKFRRDSGQ